MNSYLFFFLGILLLIYNLAFRNNPIGWYDEMVGSIRRIFNLYPGEGWKAFLFALTGLFWSTGIYGCLTLSEGMFLEKVGAGDLPGLYFILSIGLCLFSMLILFALSRLAAHRLFLSVVSSAILVYALIFFLVKTTHVTDSALFWYGFRFFGSLFDVSVYVCYWAFVDHFFDLQHAKRLFCLFCGILFLGDAIGGVLISTSLSILGPSGLIAIFLIFASSSIPLILWISKHVSPILEEYIEDLGDTQEETIPRFFASVLRSRFTLLLMLAYFAMNILAVVTEYTSFDFIELTFKNRGLENHVAEFLGMLCALISIANMIFGLFFYSRLTKKMGIANIIMIAPGFFLCTTLLWLTGDFLYVAVMGVIAKEGFTYALEDNNLNLIISGVPPRIKNQARATIEMFLEPSGMLVGAFLLTIIHFESKYLCLGLTMIALSAMFILRFEYPKAILRNLVDYSISFEKRAHDWLGTFSKKEKKEVEYLLLSRIKTADEPSKLLAYESLLKLGDKRLLPRLIHQMGLLSIPGKLKVIELLMESPFAKESSVVDLLNRWRKTTPHPAIVGSIHFYFARHKLVSPYHIAEDLKSNHLVRKGAAILSFKTFDEAKESCDLKELAVSKLKTLLTSHHEKEICMGLKILAHAANEEYLNDILPFLHHNNVKIRQLASFAINQSVTSKSAHFIQKLIEFLGPVFDNTARLYLLDAIAKIGPENKLRELILGSIHFRPSERKKLEKMAIAMGGSSKGLLLEILQNSDMHLKCRLLAAKILGVISFDVLRKSLDDILEKEINKAYFYYSHAHTIQSSEHDLEILEGALQSGYHTVIDFIIQLLGISQKIDESEVLVHSLRSKNQKLRAQALETIEKAASSRIFSLLEPLIDNRNSEEIIKFYKVKNGSLSNLWQILDVLEKSSSTSDQLISLTLKMRFQTPDWQKVLEKKIETKEEIFYHFTGEIAGG